MIKSFGDKTTSDLFHGIGSSKTRRFPIQIYQKAIFKLDMLNSATSLIDLISPPGNHLELLKGELNDFYSIRINKQWRLIFKWEKSNAYDVRIVDYH